MRATRMSVAVALCADEAGGVRLGAGRRQVASRSGIWRRAGIGGRPRAGGDEGEEDLLDARGGAPAGR